MKGRKLYPSLLIPALGLAAAAPLVMHAAQPREQKGATATPSIPRAGTAERARPNILLIMMDDMGYSDIGCYGGEIDTPNIDRLAQNGIRFTQFYNTARCCPSRASLLTGLHPHQAGMGGMVGGDTKLPGYRGDLNHDCVTIAEVLKGKGYDTYMTGKWHLSRPDKKPNGNWPCERGFDHYFGMVGGAGGYFDPPSLARDNQHIEAPKDDFYLTDAISDNACQYLKDHKTQNPNKPFFIYVAYNAPHWPLNAKAKDIAKYKGRFAEGWDVLREKRLQRQVKMGIIDPKWALSPRDPSGKPWDEVKDKRWEASRMECYAAQIDCADQGIGRIIKVLKDTKQLDNTLVIYLSDNGGCHEGIGSGEGGAKYYQALGAGKLTTKDGRPVRYGNIPEITPGPDDTYCSYGRSWANLSNTPFRKFKTWIHEGGISTPLIVQWPSRIKARGKLQRQMGQLPDIMATIVDVTGATYPTEHAGNKIHPMEGMSLVPAFENKPVEHKALYWEHIGNRGIRTGDWKLVADRNKAWELYDLKADRTELHDMASGYPDKVKELSDAWNQWAQRAFVLPSPLVDKSRALPKAALPTARSAG